MYRLGYVLALISAFVVSNHALALPGMAPDGTAIGQYDPATGQIIVSVNGVNNWYVENVGFNSMTGDDPLGLPAGGGIVTDNDTRIGETPFFTTYTATNISLGNVAQTGIADDGSLQIFWNPGLGQPLYNAPIDFAIGSINETPTASINGPFVIDLLNDPLNLTLDASGSTDDGIALPLTYRWDLDDDSIFEVDTGTSPILNIADVSTTFGGHGIYPVDVKAYDGEFSDIASTTVSLFSEPIVPAFAQYDPTTGQIVVSVYGVRYWLLESLSDSLSGDEPTGLPLVGDHFTNNDAHIGEARTNELFSYKVDLGNVAQPGLPLGDLKLYWNEVQGIPLHSVPVTYGTITPEPTGLALTLLAALSFGCCRGRWRV